MKFLIEKDAAPDHKDVYSRTALSCITESGCEAVTETLLEKGIRPGSETTIDGLHCPGSRERT